ncbi:hypothetical protein BH09BAC1_BH09BAC1_25210 [soil metagenome]
MSTAKAPPKPRPTLMVIDTKENLFKKVFLGLIVAVGILLPIFSIQTGINADERFQVYIAKYIIPFYTSFGEDQRIFLKKDEVMPVYNQGGQEAVTKQFNIDMVPQESNLMNYGGLFEFTSMAAAKVVGINTDQDTRFFDVRHFLLGLFTMVCLLFTGLIAKELLGWRAAVFTVAILLLSPRFIGHGMMNSKDIPFAMGYAIAVYYILRFLKAFPIPTWKNSVGVMIGMALALNVRVGALLLFFYFAMFCVLFWGYFQFIKKEKGFEFGNLGKAVLKAGVAGIGGYFLGLLLWPYGLIDPFGNPLAVLKEQSEFPVFINQLFEGQVVSSKDLPSYYLTKFIYMTTPLTFLVGLVIGAVLLFVNRQKTHIGLWLVLLFTAVFPLFYLSYNNTNVYNGWRHVIFVYPPLVVLAAAGFEYMLRMWHKAFAKYVVGGLFVALSFSSAIWMAATWPYQYVYFNPLAGGIKAAYGQYVTDYYMIGVKEASNWLLENEKIGSAGKPIKIATDCVYPVQIYITTKVKNVELSYQRYHGRTSADWDYAIFYSEYVNPYQLQNSLWPPDGTVYTVEAGGVPICAVLKRTDKSDYQARQMLQQGRYAEAIPLFEKAIATQKKNEELYSGLGLCYLNTGKVKEGIEMVDYSLQLNPQHQEGAAIRNQINSMNNRK